MASSLVDLKNIFMQASSSIGGASVSKTEGWGFEPLLACQFFRISPG